MSIIGKALRVLLLESFFTGSHKSWAEGLKKHSKHDITISSLPGRHWKWRMHGGAVTFAERHKTDIQKYDLIIATDMLDLATFKGILSYSQPTVLYFHENQLGYPWSPSDQDVALNRDLRYQWINLTSAMAADQIWFNSTYNRESFYTSIPSFLRRFPDHNKYDVDALQQKSRHVPLGIQLHDIPDTPKNNEAIIVWNHRWEYDKNPTLFFKSLFKLKSENIPFKLIVMGGHTSSYPSIFSEAKQVLKDNILHFGYASDRMTYVSLLGRSTIMPVTSNQDFFGISVVEGLAANCTPILPHGLAYQEFLSPEKFNAFYYNSDEEFYQLLKTCCLKRSAQDFRSHGLKYSWQKQISNYDQYIYKLFNQSY